MLDLQVFPTPTLQTSQNSSDLTDNFPHDFGRREHPCVGDPPHDADMRGGWGSGPGLPPRVGDCACLLSGSFRLPLRLAVRESLALPLTGRLPVALAVALTAVALAGCHWQPEPDLPLAVTRSASLSRSQAECQPDSGASLPVSE